MQIHEKSLGVLIDELITTNLKCWYAQEIIMNSDDNNEIAEAAKLAQKMNARRNLLIIAIDKRSNDIYASPTEKTYK